MKHYHGTNVDFKEIDLLKSNPNKDFGRGFYLTDIKEQAEALAQKKSRLFGGKAIVMEYEFDESILDGNEMKIRMFQLPTVEWAEFIYKNRNRESQFNHDYDIVIGSIADDGVAYLLGRYDEGTLSIEELCKELTFKKLNRQYFFGTEKSLNYLRRI